MSGALDRFAISPLAHSGLFGAFLGCHAISDALQILHTGVGCKGKTQRHLVEHDMGREAHAKVGWTELREAQLIKAPMDSLANAARALCLRRRPGGCFLTASAAVEYTGADLQSAARELETELGIPVMALPGLASAPDLYAGYSAVIRALVDRMARPGSTQAHRIALAGYFFHRHEHDQSANLAELRRLASALGVTLGPVLLCGEPLSAALEAQTSAAVLGLPHAGITAEELGRLAGRPADMAGLPVGLRATSQWLRVLAGLSGADAFKLQRLIQQEESRASHRLTPARRMLSGRAVAILADTPLAAALTLLCEELHLQVSLVALLDRTLGGEAAFRRLLALSGGALPPGAQLLENPSLLTLRSLGGHPDAPPSALPFQLALRPDLGLSSTGWARIPTVEIGFPATHKHFVYPMPELGYAGALALAGRMLDALLGGQ